MTSPLHPAIPPHLADEAASRQHAPDGIVVVQLSDGGWALYGHQEPGVPAIRTYAPPGSLESVLPGFAAERRVLRARFALARPSDPIKRPANVRGPRLLTLDDLGDF
jgi:hypothetical protein